MLLLNERRDVVDDNTGKRACQSINRTFFLSRDAKARVFFFFPREERVHVRVPERGHE